MMPWRDFERRLDSEFAEAEARHEAELARPFSRVPRRTRAIALVILAALAVFIAVAIWTASRPQQVTSGAGAQVGANHLVAVVLKTPSGQQVDVSAALGLNWDRAILMPAASDAAAMNKLLGFTWYADGTTSPRDPATQFLVLVAGQTVTAQIEFPASGPQFDHAIEAFTRAEASFVVSRVTGSEVLKRP